MAQQVSNKDREILRALADRQMNAARHPQNEAHILEWHRHNTFCGNRPMIHLEVSTFQDELITPLLTCEGEAARRIEWNLYQNFVNFEILGDDHVVPDYYPVRWHAGLTLFGQEAAVNNAEDSSGKNLGHSFEHFIGDLEADYDKIGPSKYGCNREETMQELETVQELFGDILPPKLVMDALYAVPTQKVVHMMGMENMYFAMCDYPELFKQMMDRIADDYITYFKWLEQEQLLLPTAAEENLGQGTFCFTNELPAKVPRQGLKTTDVWGFMDSQESVGLSEEMFSEFIFPCYRKIAENYGLLSYGCCEAVDPLWDSCISTLPNLRKVSVSPWCNEEFMGERLRGRKTVYQRKPSPNFLGVSKTLDEEAVKEHIKKTIRAAEGCTLEFTQRDVYTIHNDVNKARRYIELIRQTISDCWK